MALSPVARRGSPGARRSHPLPPSRNAGLDALLEQKVQAYRETLRPLGQRDIAEIKVQAGRLSVREAKTIRAFGDRVELNRRARRDLDHYVWHEMERREDAMLRAQARGNKISYTSLALTAIVLPLTYRYVPEALGHSSEASMAMIGAQVAVMVGEAYVAFAADRAVRRQYLREASKYGEKE